jgi:protein-disulfide isomerase
VNETILERKINLSKWPGAFHWLVTGLALGLLLTAAACTSATQTSAQPASPIPSATQTSAKPASSTPSAADPAIGPVDAPVTIIEYGDFG